MFHIYSKQNPHLITATIHITVGGLSFSTRSWKYSTTIKWEANLTHILRKLDIKYYRKHHDIAHRSCLVHLAEKVSPTFQTHNNYIKTATVTKWETVKHLCILWIWADIISRQESYPGSSYNAPVNTVWVDDYKTIITYNMKIRTLRSGALSFGEYWIGFSHKFVDTHSPQSDFSMELFLGFLHKYVDTHSPRSEFSMELFLVRVYPETIMIMGRWSSNAFLGYIWIKVINLRKSISALMIGTHALYTIPEV